MNCSVKRQLSVGLPFYFQIFHVNVDKDNRVAVFAVMAELFKLDIFIQKDVMHKTIVCSY
jgi:hypothetical protein